MSKFSRIYRLVTLNFWMKFHGNPPNSCWDISVWTDTQTDLKLWGTLKTNITHTRTLLFALFHLNCTNQMLNNYTFYNFIVSTRNVKLFFHLVFQGFCITHICLLLFICMMCHLFQCVFVLCVFISAAAQPIALLGQIKWFIDWLTMLRISQSPAKTLKKPINCKTRECIWGACINNFLPIL